jgi:hypothetical protein
MWEEGVEWGKGRKVRFVMGEDVRVRIWEISGEMAGRDRG